MLDISHARYQELLESGDADFQWKWISFFVRNTGKILCDLFVGSPKWKKPYGIANQARGK